MSESTVELRSRSHGRGNVALIAVFALIISLAVPFFSLASASADTAPPVGLPTTVSADGLPTAQINGIVWSQVVIGNTVYAGGSFTTARPAGAAAGTSEVSRKNLLAYNITTGVLISSFNQPLGAQAKVVAKSPDGSRLYVGGDFTTVNGTAHSHIVAINTSTGAIDASFNASTSGQVSSIVATNTTVYVGGSFTNSRGTARNNAAAFSAATGALLPWDPNADASVVAMTLSPDGTRLLLGGHFLMLGGKTRGGLGPVDLVSGAAVTPWTQPPMFNYGENSAFTSLTADANNVYGTGYNFGGNGGQGNFEGRFAIKSTGTVVWIDDCHGDSYSAWHMGNVLYSASHSHNCATVGAYPETDPRTWHYAIADSDTATHTLLKNTQSGYANYQGKPAPTQLAWYPTLSIGQASGAYQAAWSVAGNDNYVVYGGEFPRVNNIGQQGLVRFAVSSIAPNKRGPVASTNYVPVASKPTANTVKLTFGTTWDQDNGTLTYNVLRDSITTPIGFVTADSRFWNVPKSLTYTDNSPPNGAHTYKIQVVDPAGNSVTSVASNSVTVTGSTPNSPPTAAFSTSCIQLACTFNGTGSSDPDGTIASYSWNFGDGVASTAVAQHTFVAAGTYTVKLSVLDNKGASNTKTASVVVTTGPPPANVPPTASFTQSCTGLTCTFNGTGSTDSDGTITSYAWTFGDGATATGSTTNHTYTAGGTYQVKLTVTDNAAATNSKTTPVTVTAPNVPPTASFTQSCTGLTCTFNGTSSTDSDGTITSYAWTFGDGATATGSTTNHTYTAGGTYQVKLTVTDNATATNSKTTPVTVTAPPANMPPTASFTVSCTLLDCTFNGTDSTDPDGTITAYAWDFGDGQSATGSTTSHTFGNGGTFQVKLTVTDNDSATDSQTQPVTVVGPPPPNVPPTASFTASCTLLVCTFNAGSSTDSDGTIVSYDWDFGDGSPADTGGTVTHTYGASGTYQVKLVVTDNDGATGQQITPVVVSDVPPPNMPPTAAFTQSCTLLACTFNAGSSTDSDGTIVSYAWDFGDGDSGDGVTTSHTFASADTYQVKLIVTDNDGATGQQITPVTVADAPPPNELPTAAFTSQCVLFVCTFNATGSADPDGTIASFSWDFGDGSPSGTGVAPVHTYATSSTFAVVLTVTDNDGGTATVTMPVVVNGVITPPATTFALDTFSRTASNGWGTADTGGLWTSVTGAARLSVVPGAGRITLPSAGANTVAALLSTSSTSTVMTSTFSVNKIANGGGTLINATGRRVDATHEYRAVVKLLSNGTVSYYITKVSGTTETTIGPSLTLPGTYTPGTALNLKFEVTGTGTTALKLTVWKASDAQPANPQISTSDNGAGLQSAGSVGVRAYLSSSSTSAPVVVTFTALKATTG
jgi:PKD repeat protein